jgi:hypothetical protein
MGIAAHGNRTDIAVQQMRSYIADLPEACNRGLFPVFGRQGFKQADQVFVELGEQVSGVYHVVGVDLF